MKRTYVPLEDTENYFYTFDLGCCSALVSAGERLISLDKANPRKVRFIFARNSKIDELVSSYFADDLEVNARRMFENIKMLKSRIHST